MIMIIYDAYRLFAARLSADIENEIHFVANINPNHL
jgi:hypothetical protein